MAGPPLQKLAYAFFVWLRRTAIPQQRLLPALIQPAAPPVAIVRPAFGDGRQVRPEVLPAEEGRPRPARTKENRDRAPQQPATARISRMHRCGIMLVFEGARFLEQTNRNHFQVSVLSRNTKSMRDAMMELLALSVSVAVLGGIWAFIALGPLGGFALVWVGFIAAGCFFAAGGDAKALSKTIVGMIYGAIVAWIALLIIAKVPVPGLGTVWPAIVVGVTVFFLVIVASTDLLSCVPANVYGYAALVGYTLSAGKLDALTAADNSNPLFLIVVSAILGAVLGYLMGQLAGVLKPLLGRT